MNRIRMFAGAAAIALLGAAAPASAQISFYNICSPGAMRACASAEVFMEGPNLVMRVWNMNGYSTGASNNIDTYASEFGGWHTITAVGLRGVQYTVAPTGARAVATYVNNSNVSSTLAKWGTDASANSLQVYDTGADTDQGHKQGIVGCWNPDQAGNQNHVQTCNTYPENAYVQFTFSGLQNVNLSNATFAFHGQQVGAGYQLSVKAESPPTTVTPEPVTTLLLGSGLAGIAAARRRKKKVKDETAAAV
ncbi:MAG TPA: PEP-CTERM sorting domain-containing protein [Longimicrobiales bacterium]